MKSKVTSDVSESSEGNLLQMRSALPPKGMVRLVGGLPKNAKNIAGRRFGTLTAIEPYATDSCKQIVWLCQCDCGVIKPIRGIPLRLGHTKSCGCFKPDFRLTHPESVARFWEKVDKTDGCWLWTGNRQSKHKTLNKGGYGTLARTAVKGARPKIIYAHRFSWELHFGPIPDGMFVCHHCDVVLCVRPDHLFLGTAADNNADMTRKGRRWSPDYVGENHPRASVTEADVSAIRRLRASKVPRAIVAAQYEISNSNVSAIANRQNWKHVK